MAAKKQQRKRVENLQVAALHALSAKLDAGFAAVHAKFDAKFDAVDARFDAVDARFDAMDTKFDALASLSLTLVDRVDRLQDETIKGFIGMRRELDGVNRRIDVTNARLEGIRDLAGDQLRAHGARLAALEAKK